MSLRTMRGVRPRLIGRSMVVTVSDGLAFAMLKSEKGCKKIVLMHPAEMRVRDELPVKADQLGTLATWGVQKMPHI